MVQFIPAKDDWAKAFREIGSGVTKGYMDRSDESSLQKAIGGLGDKPTPRQILDAVTNTKTYSPEAKQGLLKNYLGVSEFEELQRKAKESERIAQLDLEQKEASRLAEIAKKEKKEQQDKLIADEKEAAKIKAEQNDTRQILKASGKFTDEEIEEKVLGGLTPASARIVAKPDKKKDEQKEEEKAKNVTQNAFNDLAALIPKVGVSGLVTSKFGGETAKAYSEFSSLTGALESLLVEKVNRGALSNARFKYITETLLPKPSDSQADIEGKLTGLATILELDPSALKGTTSKEKPSLSSFKKG